MNGDNRIIYVPMESRAREFDARLLLSLKAASANFQVILGPRSMFTVSQDLLPRGIYCFKTLNLIDAKEIRTVQNLGHMPVAWDEEGPGQIIPKIYLMSINDDAVDQVRGIYAWGGNQASALVSKYPDAKAKIEATGNPRWDLLRPEYRRYYAPEADALKARFGRFILMNTNFSAHNSWLPDSFNSMATLAADTGILKRDDDSDQQMLRAFFDFEKHNFESYADVLPALSTAFPQHTIIVRPHPTENHDRWKEIGAPFPNVQYVYEGTVTPWLIAAEAVIQNSCTTGVEAFTLGKPVISYCKGKSPLLEWHLANEVCPRVYDEDELIRCLRAFTSDATSFSEFYAAGRQKLAKHISNLEGETSCDAIIRSFGARADDYERQGNALERTFSMPQGFRAYSVTKYQRLKMPVISPQDVVERLKRLAKLEPKIGTITMSHIGESCFYFRR